MIGVTEEEAQQIDKALTQQINELTYSAFIREQDIMYKQCESIPTHAEMPLFIHVLRQRVLETVVASN